MNAVFEDEVESEEVPQHMTDGELVSKCMTEISQGIGGTRAGDAHQYITDALDYYYGRRPGLVGSKAKDPMASRFVSMDVMDGVEATVAEIMPTFTTDIIAFYEPEDERDEDMARTETDLVNYLFMEEYDGYTLLQTALKDALLNRNCTAKAYWDERAEVTYETLEDIPEMALQMVLQPNAENQTVEVLYQEVTEMGDPAEMSAMEAVSAVVGPEMSQQAMQSPQVQQGAQAAVMAAQDKYTIKIKRTTVKGRPVIESIPPEQVIVAGDHQSPFLHDCRFVAHEILETQSSLIEQGFDPEIVNQLGDYSSQQLEALSRSRESEEFDYQSADRSTRLIQVYECYPLIDFDGDGIAERRKVVISNNILLSNEEWGEVTLIGGVAMLAPHKYMGISMYDRLRSVQDAKTPILRSIVDGTQLSSNPRIGVVTGQVNLDDLLTSRTGGMVRMDNPNSVVTLPNPEIPQSSYVMLDYMDKLRGERGGAAVSTANQAQAVSGDTAHGIERVMSAMEMSNAVIARTIGETLIRGIFIQIHNLLRSHFQGQVSAKVGGKWITTIPSEWRKRTSVSVQIGSSHSERQRQSNVLQGIIALQKELIAAGSTMADEKRGYAAVTDAANLSGIKNPERYFLDPESEEGKQAGQAKQKQDQEQKQKDEMMQQIMFESQHKLAQAELMKGRADIMAQEVKLKLEGQKQEADGIINLLKLQLEQSQNEAEQYKDGSNLRYDYKKLQDDYAVAVAKLELEANRDMSKQVEGNREDMQ